MQATTYEVAGSSGRVGTLYWCRRYCLQGVGAVGGAAKVREQRASLFTLLGLSQLHAAPLMGGPPAKEALQTRVLPYH
jgi:hypothetical protein